MQQRHAMIQNLNTEVTHHQFADGIILFHDADSMQVMDLAALFHCFEACLSLKINSDKIEVMGVSMSPE